MPTYIHHPTPRYRLLHLSPPLPRPFPSQPLCARLGILFSCYRGLSAHPRLLATHSFDCCIQKHTNSLKHSRKPWHHPLPLSFFSQSLWPLVECLHLTVTTQRRSSRKRKYFGVGRTALIPAVPAGVGPAMSLVTTHGAW